MAPPLIHARAERYTLPVSVSVKKIHPWSLLPQKTKVDRRLAREESEHLANHFRYHRSFRFREACPPWVLGQEVGWTLHSPVTIDLSPVQDMQFSAEVEPKDISAIAGVTEFWRRDSGYIAAPKNHWLRSYQFRGLSDSWEAMFLPNGDGTVEWRLGWSLRIPEEYFLMVFGLDSGQGPDIPTGVLTSKQVNRTWDETGFSLAFEPSHNRVVRGQPIARIVLMHRETLQAGLVEEQ